MKIKLKTIISVAVNISIIFLLVVFRYSGIASFRLGEAVPMVLLPVIIAISMFFGDNASILSALLAGVLLDSMSADSSWFNTIFFVLAAAVCNFLCNRFLNRNLKAALTLTAIVSLIYFFLKYLIFFTFAGVTVNYDYFVLYLLPSVVYTALFIIPFYFLERKLAN